MLLEILRRTPSWVFVLFAALVFFGVMQSRTRQIGLARALRIFSARIRGLPS